MKKKLVRVLGVVSPAFVFASPVLAEGTGTANAAVVSAVTTTASDMTATGQAVVPIALGVVGLYMIVRYGMKLFRGITRA